MLGPGVLVAGACVGLPLAPCRLDAREQRPRGVGLAHHADGLRIALEDRGEIARVPARQAQAFGSLGIGRDAANGNAGLFGIGGQHGGYVGDGRAVAVDARLRRLVGGQREAGSEVVDDLPGTCCEAAGG